MSWSLPWREQAVVGGWYTRTLADPGFRAWAARFPLTRPIARRRSRALFDLVAGFTYSQILAACVSTGLLERLAGGQRSLPGLAACLGLAPERARMLCDAAAGLGLVRRSGEGYALAALGAALVGNEGVLAMIRHHGLLYRDLADPVALLRTEQAEGALAEYWRYGAAADPTALPAEAVGPYSELMAASQPMVAAEILAAYDLRRHRRLLDLGGGDGAFALAAARAAPGLQVTVFDLPEVAARARARFAQAGLSERAEAMAGDLRRDTLPSGFDLVTLVRVIHDHDDGPAMAILRNARQALAPGGRLVLAEPFAESGAARRVGSYFAMYLLALGSGRPRCRSEVAAMLRDAGFRRVRARRTGNALIAGVLVAQA